MKPLVSVIIPLYNAAPYIGEALESIVSSSYRPLEVVVVNDGSKDNSLQVAQTFAQTHPEVKVFSQANAGVSAARNHAIKEAKGEFILPVDADDKISPTFIEHAVEAMRDEVRVVGCRAEFFGAKEGEWPLPAFSHALLARKNMIPISSLFRKADWERAGGFCEEEIYREDWSFWISMMELGGTYKRLNEIGLYYRVLPISRRKTAKAQKRVIVDAINRLHPTYMEQHLGGPLHYHRSWSRFLNQFRSVKQEGEWTKWQEGEVLQQTRNTLRRIDGAVVKQFSVPSLWKGLWYGIFYKSKAQRSYEYAKRLKGLTPTPIAYREVRVFGILRESWYVCEESKCKHIFNELIAAPDFPKRQTILEAIGRFTATLHRQGILHQDYSGGNILFNENGTKIEVIDLNRIRFCKKLSRQQRLLNFERLNIDRKALQTIVDAYAQQMNEDAENVTQFVISHRWHKHIKQQITNL